jgi:hypothetical protein
MAVTIERPARGGAAGLGKLSFPGGIDNPENRRPEPPAQAQFAAIRHGGRAPWANVLAFPPRPRRIEVHITAVDSRSPIGRTRPLRLTARDLAQLVEAPERLEARR